MSALLALVFLVAVVCLLAKAEEKGLFHAGGCPCCREKKRARRTSWMEEGPPDKRKRGLGRALQVFP